MLDTSRLNSTSNLLLGFMPQSDRDLLGPHLNHVNLPVPDVLEQPNEPIPFVYFPEAGLASIFGDATFVEQFDL